MNERDAHLAQSAAGRPPVPTSECGQRDWAGWFFDDLVAWWIGRAADPDRGGFFDQLSEDGAPVADAPKTCLAQARVLFTLSHLGLRSNTPILRAGAHRAYEFLTRSILDLESGGYVRAVARDGASTERVTDRVVRSYDQSFVVLALVTYGRLAPSETIARQLSDCWSFIEARLTDPQTGLLLEDDTIMDPAALGAPLRAQNPHMHMFEATLQAFEMTGNSVWMDRADRLLASALRHFLDPETGTIMEFRAPDLSVAPGAQGTLREIGHQCEWAWLLHRHARLKGDAAMLPNATRMMDFAERFGFCPHGPMRGAAYDAVASDGRVMAETFLLWPQTEAGKAYVARFESTGADADARRGGEIAGLIFERYFAGRAAWCNQLDSEGRVLQPEALSRLLYHVALFVTECERVGLWPRGSGR